MTDAAGVPRIDNGLRHSAISYSLAPNPEHGVALTAQLAGNSEATIRKHYRRLLKPAQGQAWFTVVHAGPRRRAAAAKIGGWTEDTERLHAKIRARQPMPPEWDTERESDEGEELTAYDYPTLTRPSERRSKTGALFCAHRNIFWSKGSIFRKKPVRSLPPPRQETFRRCY
jgi:hypothetical protein